MTFEAFWEDHSYLSEAHAKIIYDEFMETYMDLHTRIVQLEIATVDNDRQIEKIARVRGKP